MRLTRRAALLTAAAGSLTVGCTTDGTSTGERPSPEPRVDPDVRLAGQAMAGLEAALAAAAATGMRHPAASPRLAALVTAHERHVALLADVAEVAEVATGPESSAGSPSPSTAPTAPQPPVVPGNPRRAVAAVAAGERDLARDLVRHAMRARSGPFARVLGSMAASTAQHAAALEAPRGDGADGGEAR